MPVREEADRRFEVTVRRDVRIPAGGRDLTLSADLFLPAGTGPVPVLITVLPYRRDVAAMNGSPLERWFAAHGYAALLVDMLGTGSSDGTQRPPFDPDEVDDALAALDWAIRQPWCDGTAGMWGGSYGAMTAMRAAGRRPAGLRAIVAVQGAMDPERDFVHPGGARGAFSPLGSWGLGTLFSQLLPPLDDFADTAEQARWRRRLTAPPYLLDLHRRGPGDPAWAARGIDTSAIEVPALCVTGWRDLFVDGMVRAYEGMRGPKRLVAGPWMHVMPHECPTTPIDFPGLALSWWDRWLRDMPSTEAETPPVSVYVQGRRPRWLGTGQWPPRGTEPVVELSTWDRIEPEEPDPAVGLLSGLWSTPAGAFGLPLDQHDDDTGSLCYTSPPLTEPLLISGRVLVELKSPWPRVSVKLTEVDHAQRSIMICAGLLTLGADGTGTAEIGLTPTTYEIPAGHRLRLAIAPGDFPRVWPKSPDTLQWPVVTALTLPLLSTTDTSEISYPLPENDTGELAAEPALEVAGTEQAAWEITTDLLNDSVSLRLASENTAEPGNNTHRRKHQLRVRQLMVATARRAEPEDSTVSGNIAATIEIETGEQITVDATVTATPTGFDATGRVTLDGEPLTDRRWHG
ncbi:CocE/NonD family hydrolase [Amycolatopsis lurida]